MKFLFYTYIFFSIGLSNKNDVVQPEEALKNRYVFSQPHMGTMFTIVLYDSNRQHAEKAAFAAFSKIESLNSILSDYVPESEINKVSELSGSGDFIMLSEDLYYILKESKELSEKSNGAFDITIGPLIRLWRRAFRQQEFPEDQKIKEALSRTGSKNMVMDDANRAVKLLLKGMQLDVGAIGKGYALDEAMKVLKRWGISSALIDGGGDVLVSEPPPGEKGWKIEINRGNKDVIHKQIILKNKAVATSGDTYRFIEKNGKRYSHIINPVDGMGTTNQYLVSVIAADGISADGLASALVVLGPAGFQILEPSDDTAALIISASSDLYLTNNFKKYVID